MSSAATLPIEIEPRRPGIRTILVPRPALVGHTSPGFTGLSRNEKFGPAATGRFTTTSAFRIMDLNGRKTQFSCRSLVPSHGPTADGDRCGRGVGWLLLAGRTGAGSAMTGECAQSSD